MGSDDVQKLVDGQLTDLTAADLAALKIVQTAGPAVPNTISTRQFFQQLAVDGDCTQDEALAYVQSGTLPQALSDAIAKLPAAARFAVKMKVIGANEFNRTDPAVGQLGVLLNKDDAALDRIWRLASAL